jgi:hypothetical protein
MQEKKRFHVNFHFFITHAIFGHANDGLTLDLFNAYAALTSQ